MVLGHESAGIVHKVGDKVKSLKVGDEVAMEPGVPCRRCVRCKEGKYNLCPDMAFAATPPYDGTLARYYVLPEDYCYKLPSNMSMEEGALIEPTAVAVHITRQAGIKPGDSVVVFGAGPVGLLCCAVAKAYGAKKIVTVDINDERLNFALKYAANASFKSQRVSAQENAENLIKECDLGMGADVIIDASGAEPCIQTAIHALRMGGTYVQVRISFSFSSFPPYLSLSLPITTKKISILTHTHTTGRHGQTRHQLPHHGHVHKGTQRQGLLPLRLGRLPNRHRSRGWRTHFSQGTHYRKGQV
jgi:D-xylulose reductase